MVIGFSLVQSATTSTKNADSLLQHGVGMIPVSACLPEPEFVFECFAGHNGKGIQIGNTVKKET